MNKYEIIDRAMTFSKIARREGLLYLEERLDLEKVDSRDIFEYGMRFAVDGTEEGLIDKILSNIVNQEKDEELKLLKTMQKEAVLSLQRGDNSYILFAIMTSYTDITRSDPEMKKYFEDD
jgi:flagellar motor component MotA